MIAADIDEAINFSQSVVRYHALDDATLAIFLARVDSWLVVLGALDGENENQRTVKNWKVPTQEIRYNLTALNLLGNVTDLGITLFNTCSAAKYASLAGRITGAQLAAILAGWNTVWGF